MVQIAYIYSRISSKAQEQGQGIDRQVQLAIEYCQRKGFDIAPDGHMNDIGLSGYLAKHIKEGALGLFYDRVKAGKVKAGSVLVIESLDRLSRETPVQAVERFSSLINAGIEVHELSSGQVYNKKEANLFLAVAVMERAYNESKVKAERRKHTWDIRAKQAQEEGRPMTARTPSWIDLKDKKFTFNKMQPAVKLMCSMYIKGSTSAQIVQALNDGDYPLVLKQKVKHAKEWDSGRVLKILRHKALYGCLDSKVYGVIEDYYPAVISEAEYLQIRQIKRTRKRTRGKVGKVQNVFSGLLRCGYCGQAVALSQNIKKSGVYWYARCTNKAKKGKCIQSHINFETLKSTLLKYLTTADLTFLEQSTDTAETQAELHKQQNLLEANEKVYLESLDPVVGAGVAKLRERVKGLEEQLIQEQSIRVHSKDFDITEVPADQLALNLQRVVSRIDVYGVGVMVDMSHIVGSEAFKAAREANKKHRHYIIQFINGEKRQVAQDYKAGITSDGVVYMPETV